MLKALFALVAAALFSGAALSVSLAEHPARMQLGNGAGIDHWRHSRRSATLFQLGLALISAILGIWAWWKTGDDLLLVGGLLVAAAILFTLVAIMPVNRRLGAGDSAADGPALLARWDRLHWIRTLLGLASVAAYLCAFLRP
jgi:inner membrane protein involved in colicin E2 resistance